MLRRAGRARLEARTAVVQQSVGRKSEAYSADMRCEPPWRKALRCWPYAFPPSTSYRAWISEPLARLLRFIAAALPPVGIQPAVYAPTKRRIGPIRRVLYETVFDRV